MTHCSRYTITVNGPANEIIHADCRSVLPTWPDACIDLAYLDPPFNTGKQHKTESGAFRDQWRDTRNYLAFLREIVTELRRLLKPTGSILLHCDWRTCHHLRLLLDEVFGDDCFVNHLIWRYGLGGSSPRRFARKHDDILFYSRSDSYFFDPPRVPATSVRMKGQSKKATDVLDVPAINNMAGERTGYPTQKPLALLELLIKACCPPGGIVLDPCCGSGTTLVAAARLGRSYLGIDASPEAVTIAHKRTVPDGVEPSKRRNVKSSTV